MSTPARKLVEKARIGEVLIQMGFLGEKELEASLKAARDKGLRLGQYLVAEGIVSEYDLAKALAQQFEVKFVDAKSIRPTPEALEQIPYKVAKEHKILPLSLQNGVLQLLVFDPLNTLNIGHVRSYLKYDFEILVSPETHLVQAIDQAYSAGNVQIESMVQNIIKKRPILTKERLQGEGAEHSQKEPGSVEAVINKLIEQALTMRSSDIHVEPDEDVLRIRERIDGILQERGQFPLDIHPAIVSRLKILANLDIAEKRKSQDGQFRHQFGSKVVDFRVSTLPTVKGEKVVLRILDKSNLKVNLDALDFTSLMAKNVRKILGQPYGIFLVTGPTGSGKTTTVYSMLNFLNTIDRNIITVEDPVEYRFRLINQVQVNPKIDFTFASALRTILRQDPDVIMIGEIRDRETAEIAVRAALTGHLVISTLHTNDAISSVTRLIDMGIEPFLVSSSLQGVLAQRLVRRLCPDCKETHIASQEERQSLIGQEQIVDFEGKYYTPKGCEKCFQTGFVGRSAIFELFTPNSEIRAAIAQNKNSDELHPLARKSGYSTMYEDGIRKVRSGVTTLEEVLRVTA